MPLGVTVIERDAWGRFFFRLVEFAFDNSYPTGGEAYTLVQLELTQSVQFMVFSQVGSKGYTFDHVAANKKILAYAISVAGGAAAAGTDALSMKASVVNKESATAMHSSFKEVNNTADLSALTNVRAMVLGF